MSHSPRLSPRCGKVVVHPRRFSLRAGPPSPAEGGGQPRPTGCGPEGPYRLPRELFPRDRREVGVSAAIGACRRSRPRPPRSDPGRMRWRGSERPTQRSRTRTRVALGRFGRSRHYQRSRGIAQRQASDRRGRAKESGLECATTPESVAPSGTHGTPGDGAEHPVAPDPLPSRYWDGVLRAGLGRRNGGKGMVRGRYPARRRVNSVMGGSEKRWKLARSAGEGIGEGDGRLTLTQLVSVQILDPQFRE